MPMLDVYIPSGALTAEAERGLLHDLVSALLRAEGADPTDEAMRAIAWVWVHRTEVAVGGDAPERPHYRVIARVPEGAMNGPERKAALVAEATEAFVKAEGSAGSDTSSRVWVFPHEVPEGTWGVGGSVLGYADILAMAIGDREKAGEVAARRIARSRAERQARAGEEPATAATDASR